MAKRSAPKKKTAKRKAGLEPREPAPEIPEVPENWPPEEEPPRTDLPRFNMFTWSMNIPLSDDLWLGMQARNLAMVDLGFLRGVETQALREYFSEKRNSIGLMFLSAFSQMWIFALYEFLRTWRQRARHLIKLADEYKTVQPRKQAKFLEKIIGDAKGKEKHVRIAISTRAEYVAKITDDKFMDSVRAYFQKTEGLFREIEDLRVTLAKHEIAGRSGFAAEAPGYARMSYYTGSLYWHYLTKDGGLERSERRELGDAFFEIGTTYSIGDDDEEEGQAEGGGA